VRPDRAFATARTVSRRETVGLPLAVLLVALELLEAAQALGLVRPLFTSSPSRIVKAAQWLFANGLWNDILVSGVEFVLGLGLAVAVGLPVGLALGWYPRLRAGFEPFVSMLYATPRVALLPLIILWLGIGLISKVAIVFLGAVFPIIVATATGVRTLDGLLLRCARSFGATDRQIFTSIALPGALPFILAGLRLGVGRGLVGIVVGELVAAQAGIGYMMARAGATFQTDKVFVGVLMLAGAGFLLNELIGRLEQHFDAWRVDQP
jgi:NitT/TauT family transport system permease protein